MPDEEDRDFTGFGRMIVSLLAIWLVVAGVVVLFHLY